MTSHELNGGFLRAAGAQAAVVIVLLFSGCGRGDVQVYRVAKEQSSPSASPGGQLPDGHPDVSDATAPPRLTWKTPDGWNEVLAGDFRVASFNVKGDDGKSADVSVIPLPGAAGGDVANVNRWRGQVGLQPLSPEELKLLAQAVDVAGQPAELYEQAGKNPSSGDETRILAVIQHRGGTAWFFKMTGDDKLVAQQKPAFVGFLKSLNFEGQAMAALPPSHPPIESAALPAGHPDISGAPPTAGETARRDGQPIWQVPTGWKETPPGQFLVAKFSLGEGVAQATVNVSRSAGDGGGLAANISRWRNQLGLGQVTEDEAARMAVPLEAVAMGKAMVVDMSGTDARSSQPVRLVGAMVALPGETWFYKLMGDSKIVEGHREAFIRFVQSVKY